MPEPMPELTATQLARQKHLEATEKYFASGLLTRAEHQRLVDDLDKICQTANIAKDYVCLPLSTVCNASEIAWVKAFRSPALQHSAGIAYVGQAVVGLEHRMKAIIGCFLRNYIDARFVTVQSVIEQLRANEQPKARVLAIPNFFLGKALGGSLPEWHASMLYDLLINRHAAGLKTILYISSIQALKAEHGPVFAGHIESSYLGIGL